VLEALRRALRSGRLNRAEAIGAYGRIVALKRRTASR
jgi:hypothetical protein